MEDMARRGEIVVDDEGVRMSDYLTSDLRRCLKPCHIINPFEAVVFPFSSSDKYNAGNGPKTPPGGL